MKTVVTLIALAFSIVSHCQKVVPLDSSSVCLNNQTAICKGEYGSYLVSEKPAKTVAVLIRLYSKDDVACCNDESVYIQIDNKKLCLPFISITKISKSTYLHVYKKGIYKIVLKWFRTPTHSGVGHGGTMSVYVSQKIIYNSDFFTL